MCIRDRASLYQDEDLKCDFAFRKSDKDSVFSPKYAFIRNANPNQAASFSLITQNANSYLSELKCSTLQTHHLDAELIVQILDHLGIERLN